MDMSLIIAAFFNNSKQIVINVEKRTPASIFFSAVACHNNYFLDKITGKIIMYQYIL
jgi:hypothetical protein